MENIIIRNGRYLCSKDENDLYAMSNKVVAVKGGSPEAILMYYMTSAPRNYRKFIDNINNVRKVNAPVDKMLGSRSTEDIVSCMIEKGVVSKFSAEHMLGAQNALLENTKYTPVITNNVDKIILERINDNLADKPYEYALGNKELNKDEMDIYAIISKLYEENESEVSMSMILEAAHETDKSIVYKSVYDLLNKNMLIAAKLSIA